MTKRLRGEIRFFLSLQAPAPLDQRFRSQRRVHLAGGNFLEECFRPGKVPGRERGLSAFKQPLVERVGLGERLAQGFEGGFGIRFVTGFGQTGGFGGEKFATTRFAAGSGQKPVSRFGDEGCQLLALIVGVARELSRNGEAAGRANQPDVGQFGTELARSEISDERVGRGEGLGEVLLPLIGDGEDVPRLGLGGGVRAGQNRSELRDRGWQVIALESDSPLENRPPVLHGRLRVLRFEAG